MLAAVLLLSFYECFVADHQKWSSHVFGAKDLFREVDFVGMTKFIKFRKHQQHQEKRWISMQAQQGPGYTFFDDRPLADEVDENIVHVLMGRKVRYDQFGQIVDENAPEECHETYTERELEIYETQRDLFWWYCKQDVYQSFLGGGRLA